ncbi:apoptosis regulatory protein Siva [Chanos chanos]|uniref:Apoptosis regulatory protein Siva n=1 Tax=Chanos chanos TaxID=29144 RepID=A0A6J2WCG4_CHACN|nr:apoptosis regulatory protein Siva [Chanos chanos]
MPKRSYPFSESFSSQYKIHVGQKELNHYGVFGNECRQEIYEKTKNLLFCGAKAVMGRIWKVEGDGKYSESNSSTQSVVSEASTNQTLLRGQTLIGPDGRLRKSTSTMGGAVAAVVCCVCQKTSGSMKRCSQCDRQVCPTCTQQCTSCSSLCCSICCITDYSDRYDRVLCCGCSS